MKIAELQQKRDRYGETARNILTTAEVAKRSLTEAEQRDYDGLLEKIKGINAVIDADHRLTALERTLDSSIGPTRPLDATTFNGLKYGRRDLRSGEVRMLKPDEAVADAPHVGPGLGADVRGIATGRWNGAEELRAMAEGTLSAGGYLVPTPLSNVVIDVVRNATQVVRAGAVTIPFDSATYKMARQTSDVTAAWRAENVALTFSDPGFDQVLFTARTLVAGTKIPIELVEDAPNVDQVVSNSIGKALALELDRVALYGSGSGSQPTGIKSQTNVVITDLGGNGYTLIDYSKFSAAVATLMANNFTGPFACIVSPRTAGELDNLQDTLHQPLRKPDLVAAMRFLPTSQVPNNITHGSANTASDAFVGQFDQAMIGMRTGLMLEISREAADATSSAFANLQVWIRAYLRADIQLMHPTAFNVLTGIL